MFLNATKRQKTSPVQLTPFPVNPELHLQVYDPFVLLQVASLLHLFEPVMHSFSSVEMTSHIILKVMVKVKLKFLAQVAGITRVAKNR